MENGGRGGRNSDGWESGLETKDGNNGLRNQKEMGTKRGKRIKGTVEKK